MILQPLGTLGDRKIGPLDAYVIYTACVLHFKPHTKYDAFKFNFKGPRVNSRTFEAHRHRYDFEKAARKYNSANRIIEYYLANILCGETWIGAMNAANHEAWASRVQRMDYNFTQYCRDFADRGQDFDSIFADQNGMPRIYSDILGGSAALEIGVILENLTRFTRRYINKYRADPLGINTSCSAKILSYKPFLRSLLNAEKHKHIVLKIFTTV